MKTFLIALLLLSSPAAFATPLAEMTQYFNESIQATDQAVNQCSLPNDSGDTAEVWYYRRFWLRIKPKVSFAIPLFAKLEIAPELELLWMR